MRSETGGLPPGGVIPLSVPFIAGNEWTYVKDCLDTTWVSSVGSYVDRFEQMVAGVVGTKHATAVINGTSALQIALLLAGVEPDDEVLVSTLTFIAPVNAIRYIGAWPVLMDADPIYWQMDAAKTVDFLQRGCSWRDGALWNRTSGRRVRAVLPVHVLGHPVDMDPITEAASRFGLSVVEDATESLGARYKERPVGHLGDAACLSFNGNKLFTTGGGGMIVTDHSDWATRAAYLTTQAKDDPIEYEHGEIGYNFRLTNVLAAIGCAQIEQSDQFLAAKRRIAGRYNEALSDIPGIAPMAEAAWASSAWWMYTVLVDEAIYGADSRSLLRRMGESGVQCRPLWQPMHRSKAHIGAQAYRIEIADQLHARALSLPCSVGLSEEDQGRVITLLREYAKAR
jgi:perosamine synthetase